MPNRTNEYARRRHQSNARIDILNLNIAGTPSAAHFGWQMQRSRGYRLRRLAITCWLTTACYTTTPLSTPRTPGPYRGSPPTVRVIMRDKTVRKVHRPWVEHDSLYGYELRRRGFDTVSVAIPLSAISRAETRHFNLGETALGIGAVAGGTAIVLLIGLVVAAARCHC